MVDAPAHLERRDVAARTARDQLAVLLDVHPRRLGALDAELARLLSRRIEHAESSIAQASRDELTGLLNRSVGQRALEAEIQRAHRAERALSVIFADVDGMKQVNDTRGHAGGDRVLQALGAALREVLRPYDLGVRWGGDEFVVVLPEVGLDQAQAIGERVTERFAELTSLNVTCGSAELQREETAASLVERADREMYGRK